MYNINYIPKLLKSTKSETYINYITGGLIGGSLCHGVVLLTTPHVVLSLTLLKIISTIGGICTGSYLLNNYSENSFEKINEIKRYCIENDNKFFEILKNNSMEYF